MEERSMTKFMGRRIGLLVLVGVLAAAAAGCGSSGSSGSSASSASSGSSGSGGSSSQKQAGKGITIGFVELFDEPYALQIANGIKAAAAEYGASVKVSGPSSINPSQAITDFQNLATTGAKGILTMAYPAEQWTHPIATAIKQGIDVDTIDISSPASGASFHVGAPRQQMGAADAKVYAQKLGPHASGTVIAGICVPGLPQLTSPVQGFVTEMHKIDPGITVKTVATGGSDEQDFAAWQRIIAQNPTALGFFGPCDQDLPALVKLKQSSPSSKWLSTLTSGGENPIGWTAIPKGELTTAVTQRGFVEGYVAAKLMLEHLIYHKAEPKGWIDTGFDLMDKSTVAGVAKALSSTASAQAYYSGLLKKLTTNPPVVNPVDAQQNTFTEPNPSHTGSNVG
jgi:ABC-type sugar transport system substrate-binding protein